jgi:hypothetical protein
VRENPHDELAIWGHVPFGLHRIIPGPTRYFTILRDPVDRAVSAYHYARSVDQRGFDHPDAAAAKRMSMLEFLAQPDQRDVQTRYLAGRRWHRLSRRVRNPIVDRLMLTTARRHLNHMALVGHQHDLPRLLRQVRENWGWIVADSSSTTIRTWSTPQRPGLDEITVEDRHKIRQLNALDIELLKRYQSDV